jgi:aminoglycoside/choline kinase family phosphotransferase
VPPYDDALLQREMDLLPQWYLTQLRGLTLTDDTKPCSTRTFALIKSPGAGPASPVLVHRDYHSRNLMADPLDPRRAWA